MSQAFQRHEVLGQIRALMKHLEQGRVTQEQVIESIKILLPEAAGCPKKVYNDLVEALPQEQQAQARVGTQKLQAAIDKKLDKVRNQRKELRALNKAHRLLLLEFYELHARHLAQVRTSNDHVERLRQQLARQEGLPKEAP